MLMWVKKQSLSEGYSKIPFVVFFAIAMMMAGACDVMVGKYGMGKAGPAHYLYRFIETVPGDHLFDEHKLSL
jgi:hypothetical protein